MRKLIAAVAMLVGVVAASPGSVGAGGWAVISLDVQPELIAGDATDIGFILLRHGVTAESSDDVTFVLTDEHGSSHRFTAVPDGAIGHHVVTVDVPSEGDYRLTVLGPFIDVDLGPIAVGAGSAGGSTTLRWDALQWGTASLALVMAGLAATDIVRTRRLASTSVAA